MARMSRHARQCTSASIALYQVKLQTGACTGVGCSNNMPDLVTCPLAENQGRAQRRISRCKCRSE